MDSFALQVALFFVVPLIGGLLAAFGGLLCKRFVKRLKGYKK